MAIKLLFKSETKNIENLTGNFLSLKRTLVFTEIVLNWNFTEMIQNWFFTEIVLNWFFTETDFLQKWFQTDFSQKWIKLTFHRNWKWTLLLHSPLSVEIWLLPWEEVNLLKILKSDNFKNQPKTSSHPSQGLLWPVFHVSDQKNGQKSSFSLKNFPRPRGFLDRKCQNFKPKQLNFSPKIHWLEPRDQAVGLEGLREVCDQNNWWFSPPKQKFDIFLTFWLLYKKLTSDDLFEDIKAQKAPWRTLWPYWASRRPILTPFDQKIAQKDPFSTQN